MKVNRISHIPYSHRVGLYHFQMVQSKLHAPVDPIISYSLQPFYIREQQWMTALSDSLSRLYRYSSDLDKAAREFASDRRDSAIGKRLAISSAPETATAEAQSHARIREYRLDHTRLASAQPLEALLEEGSAPATDTHGQRMAEVIVDGTPLRFPENRFTIGDGEVHVSLHQNGTAPVTISVVPDTDRLLRQTRILVDCFNRLQMFLHERRDTLSTHRLDTFARIAQAADATLHQYGIRLQADGQLELDGDAWLQAVQNRFADFAHDIDGLSQQFREQTMRVQSQPSGVFSRSYDDAVSRQPYVFSSPSAFRYLHAVSTGLFVNLLF